MSELTVPLSRGHSPSTSMSLLEMASAGDGEAWNQIVFLYSPLVDCWCRARKLKPDTIDGIGQEVFLALFKNLGQFKKDEPEQGFRRWLWKITQNKIIDYFRQVQNEPPCVGGSAAKDAIANLPGEMFKSGSGGEHSVPSDRLIVLRRCLEKAKSEFEPRTYQAFWEVVMEGKPPDLVARSLAMKSTGAVYTARSRVMKRLRELLEGLEREMSGL
jgi:RNA polymerase sigma-70 factor, ECF subfamily